jgi:putative glycosyltransferase (TIGR04372 family)
MPEIVLTSFDQPTYLRIPEAQVESLSQELVSSGLDPKRWFCVLNYREPGYRFRPPRDLRDLNPDPFIELTQDIITNLGGQVVRVGHPNMSAFPKRDGFADLAPLEDNFALHAFAISRARFLVGLLTGISHLGSAVNTPTLITNCSDSTFMPGCWHAHDLALNNNLYDSNGRRISTEEQHDQNLHRRKKLLNLINQDGYFIYQNNTREMAVAVRRMMDTTATCQGWRLPHIPVVLGDRPNRFEFPMAPQRRVPIVEYPDLAARP